MATDSSMLLYFAYFLHRTLVPKANSFLSSAAEHVIPGCPPYPFRSLPISIDGDNSSADPLSGACICAIPANFQEVSASTILCFKKECSRLQGGKNQGTGRGQARLGVVTSLNMWSWRCGKYTRTSKVCSINKLLCRRMRLCVPVTKIVNEHKKLVLVVPDTAMQIGDLGTCGFLGLRYTDASIMTELQSRELTPRLRWSLSTYCCGIARFPARSSYAYRVRTQ
jgi:hypothetical protein